MSKNLLGISMDVVNGIWRVGTETYKVVKNEVNNTIDNEAKIRTKKVIANRDDNPTKYQRVYDKERKKVKEEAKELAVKGGLLVVGLGFFL